MGAAVHERTHGAVAVAHHDDRLAPHTRREEIARVPHLALVAEDQPRAAEDPVELQLEQHGIGVDGAVDAVGLDQTLDGLNVHGSVL
jgi:hypothetical protein